MRLDRYKAGPQKRALKYPYVAVRLGRYMARASSLPVAEFGLGVLPLLTPLDHSDSNCRVG